MRLLYLDCVRYIANPPRPSLLVNTGVTLNGKPFAVRRDQIQEYLNEYFFYYYDIFTKIKTFGLPNAKGWVNEPQHIIDAYMALDSEQRAIEAERTENK